MRKLLCIALLTIGTMSLFGCDKKEIVKEKINNMENKTTNEIVMEEEKEISKLGITLTTKNVTSNGLTIVCTQKDGNVVGELQTGSDYVLEKLEKGEWIKVEYAPQEYDVAWTAEAWIIPKDSEVEWNINWQWLYGELKSGEYRIGKSIMDFKGTGDYEEIMHYAKFIIE